MRVVMRVSCVTCGYDDYPATYVVYLDEDGDTHVYCEICARIANLLKVSDERNG